MYKRQGHAHGGQVRLPGMINGLFAPHQGAFPDLSLIHIYLYALPERFPGYEDLTGKRSEIQAGLEMEYGTTVETAVIYSGDNTSVIQFQDMDGDGSQETAVISFRIPGAERSLRVYFLTTQGDTERYEISAVVEGDGTGINAIDYVELSGSGKKEVVVSWRTIEGVNQLGVYSLDLSLIHISVVEGEVERIPEEGQVIVAAGPLASDALTEEISRLFPDSRYLNFFDAAAPLVTFESVNMERAWFASR